MRMKRLTIAALAAALAVATTPTVILPAAADEGQDCGYRNENGKLVFLGTCPHGTSADSNDVIMTDAPPVNPCPGRVDDGEFLMAC